MDKTSFCAPLLLLLEVGGGGKAYCKIKRFEVFRIVRYSSRTYIVEKSYNTRNVKNAFSSTLESSDFSPSSREHVLVSRRTVVMRIRIAVRSLAFVHIDVDVDADNGFRIR